MVFASPRDHGRHGLHARMGFTYLGMGLSLSRHEMAGGFFIVKETLQDLPPATRYCQSFAALHGCKKA
jgi:hypothetical protein